VTAPLVYTSFELVQPEQKTKNSIKITVKETSVNRFPNSIVLLKHLEVCTCIFTCTVCHAFHRNQVLTISPSIFNFALIHRLMQSLTASIRPLLRAFVSVSQNVVHILREKN